MKKMFLVVKISMFLVFFMTKNTTQAAVTLLDSQAPSAIVYGFDPAEYLRFNFSFTIVSDHDIFVSSVIYDTETFGSSPSFDGLSLTSALPAEGGYIRLLQNTPTNLNFQGWVTVDRTSMVKVFVSGINVSPDKITNTVVLFDSPLETQTNLLNVIPEPSTALMCFGLLGLLARRSR